MPRRLPRAAASAPRGYGPIKADILAHLHDGDLNATDVAARKAVTVRYLHKLFEKEGISYSEFVIAERLACAYRILTTCLTSTELFAAATTQHRLMSAAVSPKTSGRNHSVSIFPRCLGWSKSDWPCELHCG